MTSKPDSGNRNLSIKGVDGYQDQILRFRERSKGSEMGCACKQDLLTGLKNMFKIDTSKTISIPLSASQKANALLRSGQMRVRLQGFGYKLNNWPEKKNK